MKRLLVGAICLAAASASADTRTTFPQQGDSINEDNEPVVTNDFGRPRLERVWVDVDPGQFSGGPLAAVNSNKIYLNRCAGGCVIRSGSASSIDGSGYQGMWGISGTKTLQAFNQSDAVWNGVVTCMRDVFSRFGVEITETNPSPAPHFEIMIAGSPTNLGMSNGIGGISPFSCQQYIPNSLVFAFANISIYQNNVNEICATAAQEVAHSFALDHVTDPSDPLTYFNYSGRRQFKDAQVTCGSDCQGGQSPQGATCTGSNQQTHACACGGATQNSVAKIKALFGSGTPTPPMIKITSPMLGESVAPGFPIRVEATDDNGIGNVTGTVDGMPLNPTTIVTAPYAFNAPAGITDGTHTVRMIATDIYGTQSEASVQVIIGEPCSKPADCPNDTDTCIGGRCVTGPGVQGGLGSTCNAGPDCASGQCAQDSSGAKHCVEPCALDEGQCPDGFGCLPTGDTGVCWPGYDDGSGGICSVGGPGGQITLGLAFASMLFARRRRRSK